MRRVRLAEVAQVVRSKNAGPFLLTLDVVFRREEDYQICKQKEVFSRQAIAELYGLSIDRVLAVTHYDPARAVKATLQRAIPSGSPGDTDVYGSQQHAPLLSLEVPVR